MNAEGLDAIISVRMGSRDRIKPAARLSLTCIKKNPGISAKIDSFDDSLLLCPANKNYDVIYSDYFTVNRTIGFFRRPSNDIP
jgi:hypothetical protein